MKTIEQQFNAIYNAIATIHGGMDYAEVVEAIITLSQTVAETEIEESVWYIGEGYEFCLADLFVGAYWHFSEWHAGQNSRSYLALCELGRVFSPGMSCEPEEETGEFYAYEFLQEMAEKA